MRLFKSKSDTLLSLSKYEELNIPPLFVFSTFDWNSNRLQVLDGLKKEIDNWNCKLVAVRSSCSNEDNEENSGAGAYTSVLNVPMEDLGSAIDKVVSSYKKADPSDQVLVQAMLTNIMLSGVIMTRVLSDGAPYYSVNYVVSDKSDLVTSGQGICKTVFVYCNASSQDYDSKRLEKIVNFAKHVESLCHSSSLDIEFCITEPSETINLLQVRPICRKNDWQDSQDQQIDAIISKISAILEAHFKQQPGLSGKTSILGVMPDWNPAEMLGVIPRRLSYSLYRELITSQIWSQARALMGYKNLPPNDLMVILYGRPYIDVRLSCNSFLPNELDPNICEILVNAFIERLDKHPEMHDKLEFEIVPTCLNFAFDSSFAERYHNLFDENQKKTYKEALRKLTSSLISSEDKTVEYAIDSIKKLKTLQKSHSQVTPESTAEKIKALIDECKLYGTLPFAMLARHAFIAEDLLRSACLRGAISKARISEYKNSITTISDKFSNDYIAALRGEITQQEFLTMYGHLRPNTYDILSPSYAERPDLFMVSQLPHKHTSLDASFRFTEKEKEDISCLLREANLPDSFDNFDHYVRTVIPAREQAKFIFTRHLSSILNEVVIWGANLGFSRDDLSYLDIGDILKESRSGRTKEQTRQYVSSLSQEGMELFKLSQNLKLGYIIRSVRDVKIVAQHRSTPNFSGRGHVEAPIQILTATSTISSQLDGHVICIENADPGFDWIFTRKIAGLITMFGGTNSHMAIRCAEYNIPAAIGVGEVLFKQISKAPKCILDPDMGILKPLNIIENE